MPLSLPPPDGAALLLDIDGTLLDLAPTPESVVVPPELTDTLRVLRGQLGNALAVVSGRPVEQADALLGDAPYAVAGEHGGAIRHGPGQPVVRARLPDLPAEWVVRAAEMVSAHPGARLEQKLRGLVFHYRQAPAAGPALHTAALALVAADAARFAVLEASMAWEIRPRGVDKGVAVESAIPEVLPSEEDGSIPVLLADVQTYFYLRPCDTDYQAAMDLLRCAGAVGKPVRVTVDLQGRDIMEVREIAS